MKYHLFLIIFLVNQVYASLGSINFVTPYTMLSPNCPVKAFSIIEDKKFYTFDIKALYPWKTNDYMDEEYLKSIQLSIYMDDKDLLSNRGNNVSHTFRIPKKYFSLKDILSLSIRCYTVKTDYEILKIKKPSNTLKEILCGETYIISPDYKGCTWIVDIKSFMKERSIWQTLLLKAYNYNLYEYTLHKLLQANT